MHNKIYGKNTSFETEKDLPLIPLPKQAFMTMIKNICVLSHLEREKNMKLWIHNVHTMEVSVVKCPTYNKLYVVILTMIIIY